MSENTPADAKPKRRGGGSRKGIKNRLSQSALETVLRTFTEMGGVAAFVKWAKAHPRDFYMGLYAKRIPAAHELDAQVNGNVTVRIVRFTDPEPEKTDGKLK